MRLDSVYFGTELHDLLAHGVTLRCRTGRTEAGWQLKTDNGCSTSRSGRGGGFTSSSESSPYLPAPSSLEVAENPVHVEILIVLAPAPSG